MKKIIKNPLIKLLLIIELLKYIFPKSILIANGIYNDKYIPDKNKFIFNIQASLTGILTKSMLDNFIITINNNDESKALCIFSEEKNYVYNKTILLNCSFNRVIYNQYNTFSLSFKGTNKFIDLKNFNENTLYLEKTLNNNIILILGDIIEQSCKQSNELYYYNYKIKIENKTIPKILEIYNNDYDLKPNGLDNNKYKYNNITCSIENNNIDNFINCSLVYYKKIINTLYYEQKYIYKKEINNYSIYFKNNNENLYIGKNINCKYVNENIINYIDNLNLRILNDNSNETNPSESIYDDDEPTPESIEPEVTHNIIEDNVECLSICDKCSSSPSHCTECKTGYYLKDNSCNLCPSGCTSCKDNNICNECLNKTFLQYKLNNGKCDLVVEKEQNDNENTINKEIKLKYERMDSFKTDDNNQKVYFNTHFWILNYFLYGAKLIIKANIKSSGNRILLRNLDSLKKETKDIDCTQYGDVTTNYLVNFLCSFDSDKPNNIISIEPIEYNIENVGLENIQIEEYNVSELKKSSLEVEYEDSGFNKLLITDITDIKLDKKLTLNLKGSFDNEIQNDDQYEIILKKINNSEQIKGDCDLKKSNKYLSCSFTKSNIKEKETLDIEEGMYKAQQNKDILIISNLNKKQIKVPKKSISVGAIVGISVAGVVILIPFVVYLVKYLISKKESNENNVMNDIYEGNDLVNINENRRNHIPNRENSNDEVLKDNGTS